MEQAYPVRLSTPEVEELNDSRVRPDENEELPCVAERGEISTAERRLIFIFFPEKSAYQRSGMRRHLHVTGNAKSDGMHK
jgi:hypothetical protein